MIEDGPLYLGKFYTYFLKVMNFISQYWAGLVILIGLCRSYMWELLTSSWVLKEVRDFYKDRGGLCNKVYNS